MIIIGIDPGITGALAIISDDKKIVELTELPVMAKKNGKAQINGRELAQLIYFNTGNDEVMAIVEQVGAMPGQGVSSMFSFGDSFGCIRGVLATMKISTEFVTPQAWKKHYKLAKDKEQARAKAIQLFPQADLPRKKDSGKAEALLIAAYGLQILSNNYIALINKK